MPHVLHYHKPINLLVLFHADTYVLRIGVVIRPRKAPIRPQTVRLRRSNKTRLPQESQDNEEGGVKIGMHILQDEGTACVEEM